VSRLGISVRYHAYRRFAREVLGVDLETWLGCFGNGVDVCQAIGALLDDAFRRELAEERVLEILESGTGELDDCETEDPLKDMADMTYWEFVVIWEDAVANIPY
jgi:hypothetical protein